MTSVEIVPEYALSTEALVQICALQGKCADSPRSNGPVFVDGAVFRALLRERKALRAQAAFRCQTIVIKDRIVRVFGLNELCIEDGNNASLADLLHGVEAVARQQRVEFLLHDARDCQLLLAHGFQHINNDLRTALEQRGASAHCLLMKTLQVAPQPK